MKKENNAKNISVRNESVRPKMLYKVLLDEYTRLKLLSSKESAELRRLARQKRKEKHQRQNSFL